MERRMKVQHCLMQSILFHKCNRKGLGKGKGVIFRAILKNIGSRILVLDVFILILSMSKALEKMSCQNTTRKSW